MDTRKVATVFGGSGFIGRSIVQQLVRQDYTVRVAVRRPLGAEFLRMTGQVGQVVPMFFSLDNADSIRCVIEGADVVVNCLGILSERRSGDFQRVHKEGPQLIAQSAARAGVRCLVHLSALGADPNSPSLYARSKAEGEVAVHAAFPSAIVLRPAVVFGAQDRFFNMFARLASRLPFMPVIAGSTRFQPVYVGDVAQAVACVVARDDVAGHVFELGGPDIWSMRDLMAWVVKTTRQPRYLVNVPWALARVQACLGRFLPGDPLTCDQLLLLQRDNVVGPDALGLAQLGIVPAPMDMVVPDYLACWVRPDAPKKAA